MLRTHVKHVHELSDVSAESGHELPGHVIRDKPQYRILPHVFDAISSPFNSLDGTSLETVRRLLDQAGWAGEGELGGDLGGHSPERVVCVDTGATLAKAQDLPLHHLVLVVDKTLHFEYAGSREHRVQHLASHAVVLRVALSEEGLVGVERLVVTRVFEELGILAVDGLVELDVVDMELVGSDAKSMSVYQGVSRSVKS